MIHTGRDTSGRQTVDCDVAIVGSGCGGATAAAVLSGYGRKVVILEKGSYRTSKEFNMREVDMYSRLYAESGMTGPEDLSSVILYGQTVGGSSVHYMANSLRTPASRFERWEKELGLKGVSAETMAPYYQKVEERHHVHPAEDWEMNPNNRLFRKGVEALGWKGRPMPHARKDCTNLGYCLLGCPVDRKQSQLVTNIPLAIQQGAELYADARVDRIVVENGRARGFDVTVWNPETHEASAKLQVRSKVSLVACGGVGTPYLLLENRLGNSSGQVGKNLLVTPHFFIVGLFGEVIEAFYGMPSGYLCDQWIEVQGDAGGYMVQGIFGQPGFAAVLLPGGGKAHREFMKLLSRCGALLSLIDDEEPGQVTVDAKRRRPKIDYHLRGRDIPKARDFFKKAAQILLAAGAEKVLVPDVNMTWIESPAQVSKLDGVSFEPGMVPFVGTSNQGTCRMGEDRSRCVVNSECESFDVRNLFLADGSVLPTGLTVDPSLTIMANSWRVSDRIQARWDELGKG